VHVGKTIKHRIKPNLVLNNKLSATGQINSNTSNPSYLHLITNTKRDYLWKW